MKSDRAAYGQTATEYMLLGTAVLLAVGMSVFFLGDTVSNVFSNMLNQHDSLKTAALMPPSSGGAITEPLGGSSAATTSAVSTSLSLRLANGSTLNLDNYPVELSRSIQTAGANGTTQQLLANMRSLFEQLKKEGGLTSPQESALSKLANQGFLIGSYEKGIEDALIQSDGTNLSSLTATVNGETKRLVEFYGTLGYNDSTKDQATVKLFRQYYDEAVAAGALSDPVTNRAVSILVDQIANIANGVENAADAVVRGDNPAKDFHKVVSENLAERDVSLGLDSQTTLLELGASVVTKADAGKICKVGQGQDTGASCQP